MQELRLEVGPETFTLMNGLVVLEKHEARDLLTLIDAELQRRSEPVERSESAGKCEASRFYCDVCDYWFDLSTSPTGKCPTCGSVNTETFATAEDYEGTGQSPRSDSAEGGGAEVGESIALQLATLKRDLKAAGHEEDAHLVGRTIAFIERGGEKVADGNYALGRDGHGLYRVTSSTVPPISTPTPLTAGQREAAELGVTTAKDILQDYVRARRSVSVEVAMQLMGQLERVLDQLANGGEGKT